MVNEEISSLSLVGKRMQSHNENMCWMNQHDLATWFPPARCPLSHSLGKTQTAPQTQESAYLPIQIYINTYTNKENA